MVNDSAMTGHEMIKSFSTRLLTWFDEHGRQDMPWQRDSDPYKIWLSEVMLQQTQVSTVIPYFERFLERFPSVAALANAEQDEVLHLWSGLGYYARGRNLHTAAQKVLYEFDGVFPVTQELLESLPGVGRSTAGAIRAQAFEKKAAILDGNVKRVLSRLSGLREWPGSSSAQKELWALSEKLLPETRLRDYTQAIMDLGATTCVRNKPVCEQCPFKVDCVTNQENLHAEIPTRKPKKQKPVRETIFLVVVNDAGELLLEKRPPAGIWGGLWSFPETVEDELEQALQEYTDRKFNRWLEGGSHVFSHFQLNYRPLLIKTNATQQSQVNEADRQIWYSDALSSEIGLSAPVIKLLKQIQEQPNG